MDKPPTVERPQKICMLVHQDYYIDARVMQYVDILTANGYCVDILCSRLNNPPPPNSQKGVNVYPIPIGHGQGSVNKVLLEYLMAFFYYSIRLTQLFFKHNYSLIHVHNMPDFLVFSAAIPKLLGAKVILDIHDPMPEFYLSKFAGKQKIICRLLQFEEYLSALFSDAVITANPIFKENLVQRGIKLSKITVIANYPDPKIFIRDKFRNAQRPHREVFRLIYPGTIAARYGLDIPIRALVRLVKHIPQIQLRLIGPPSSYAIELQKLADNLGVGRCLEIHPAIPINQVPMELAQANVGIYTARPDAHMDIAISGKILEYALMGIPIVSARLRIMEILFPPDCVLYFPPGDVDAFSDRILDLNQQPDLNRRLVERMDAALFERHSWQKEHDQYLFLVQTLLRRKEK